MRTFLEVALVAYLTLGAPPLFGAPDPPETHWVGTWSAAPQLTEEVNLPPRGFHDMTLRQVVHLSIGGRKLRLRLSNAFGKTPLEVLSVHVARSKGGDAIEPGSDLPALFNGKPSARIPPGEETTSDPFDLQAPPLTSLAVTVLVKEAPQGVTGHPGSRTTSYLLRGGEVAASRLSGATTVDHWYFLTGVEVLSPSGAAALVVLGDSITDGRGSTTNGNDRWPDVLSARLRADPATANVAVLNQGIGGNRLLADVIGPSALSRLDREVLRQTGARWLVVLEGINDIGARVKAREASAPWSKADEIIAAYQEIVLHAHSRGLRVFGGTLLPYEGAAYFSEDGEADRQTINRFIRTSGLFDGVIDFDAVTRDPARPSRLAPDFDSGDHLHLSAAGYREMGEAVDLFLFRP